jgi:hypothetical protein
MTMNQATQDRCMLDAARRMDLDAVERDMMSRVALGLPFPWTTEGNALKLLFVRLRAAEAQLDNLL